MRLSLACCNALWLIDADFSRMSFCCCRKLLILDGLNIWKISMNGTKPQSMAIDGLSSNLALDYVNKYLYYLSLSSHRIYRIDYEIFTAPPQSILWLTKDTVSNFL